MLATYKAPQRGARTWLGAMTVFSSFRAFLAGGADLPAGCRSLQNQGKALRRSQALCLLRSCLYLVALLAWHAKASSF